MMNYYRNVNSLILMLTLFSLLGTQFACKKQDDFLNALPNQQLTVPSTLGDLRQMIQNQALFNAADPGLIHISGENMFVSQSYYNTLALQYKNTYTWAKDMFPVTFITGDWSAPYQQVQTANIVLETLDKLKSDNGQRSEYNAIKGSALFYRAWAFFNLTKEFALPYDPSTATQQLGIPLRLNSSLDVKSVRATIEECYSQIITDSKEAEVLLPVTSPNIATPTQAAAKGFLARVYLSMGKYAEAHQYADACLQVFSTLTDFNLLSPQFSSVSTDYLSEDFYHTVMQTTGLVLSASSQAQVDSTFYASYDSNDLRKSYYFNMNAAGRRYFRGSYDPFMGALFSGLATDELLLTRAECLAREGKKADALVDLNKLLRYRYKAGTFVDYVENNVGDVLRLILKEREKELAFRGARWLDLRRLNREQGYQRTLTRSLSGTTFTLAPQSPNYALSIPDQEIQISGISQNPRN